MAAILLFVSLILFLLFSVPVDVSLGPASLATVRIMDCISMTTFVQSVIQGLNSFPLMAVSLFTFTGGIMGKGGISKRLIDLARVFTGRFTGGLGIMTIVTSLFFVVIAGTGFTAVAAIGPIMIPAVVKNGHDKEYSSILVTIAGIVGVVVPPSVCMVVYAVVTGTLIDDLFMAGIMPRPLVEAGLILYLVFYSRGHGYKGEDKQYTPGEVWQIILKAVPDLIIPIIILGNIYGGVFTPTEAATMAGVYNAIVEFFTYREIRPSDLIYTMYRFVPVCAPMLFIIGVSTGSGRILTIARVPVMIADVILELTSNKILVLPLINVLLLIAEAFIETNVIIIILTPILLPIVTRLGANPVRFGIIVVMNLSIGFITPPLGANLFMACQVGGVPFDKLAQKMWPWVVAMVVLLMLVTCVPQISMTLPGAMRVV